MNPTTNNPHSGNYQFVFKEKQVENQTFYTLASCLRFLLSNAKTPEKIVLPNSMILYYNDYLAHSYLDKGMMSESEFIEISQINATIYAK